MNQVNMEESCRPRSDQMNADDFIGGPKTFVIERVSGNEGNKEQPVNIYMKGNPLPYRPSKSMRRVFLAVYGPDASKYAGKSITLFRNPDISFGGVKTGGIQISHMSGIENKMTVVLTSSRTKRAPFTVQPLTVSTPTEPKPDNTAALQSARDAAKTGSDGFRAWWKDNADKRSAAGDIMDELKKLAADADAAMVPDVDDDEVPL